MKKFKAAILICLSLPSRVIGLLYVLLAFAFMLAHRLEFEDNGVVTAEWRLWFASKVGFSVTSGHGIIYMPSVDMSIHEHEHVHVRQCEDACALSFLIGVILIACGGNWIISLIMWMTAPAQLLLNYFTGWLRFGDSYTGAEHERSAYAQTDVVDGESWLERHIDEQDSSLPKK